MSPEEGLDTTSVAQSPTLVRVAIPHYCRLDAGFDTGYGSSRNEARVLRGVGLARCLGAVLGLARGGEEQILNIAQQTLLNTPDGTYPAQQLSSIWIDCHVFVTGDHCLSDILAAFDRRITVHHLDLSDPKQLPHAARTFLLEDAGPGDAELSLYFEDDLVVQDRLFVDKLIWFLRKTNHQCSLMPHRFELTGDHRQPRLFVDGPISNSVFPDHHQPRDAVAQGVFWDGQSVSFDLASNPHSGCFSLSAPQRKSLVTQPCSQHVFIGPLETVATWTVLQRWPVMKPSWPCRDFLLLEHAHPSFLWARHHWDDRRS